jgi:tetratricopeptide (TPR) repeat protein
MKRCPECRRDYYDDSLTYCLDDGAHLLEGPSSMDETAVLERELPSEAPTQHLGHTGRSDLRGSNISGTPNKWIVVSVATILVAAAASYVWYSQTRPQIPPGSFRSIGSPAYDYYLPGKLYSSSEDRDQNEKAIKILQEVVQADSTFAPAHAELARALSIRANYWTPEAEKATLYEQAKLLTEKSLALEPDLAEGHFVRGAIIWTHADRFPHEQAVSSLKRAIALDPGLEEAHQQLGVVYSHIGLFEKSEEEFKKTLEINPGNAVARLRLGILDLQRCEYARALVALKQVPPQTSRAIVERSMATALLNLAETDEASKIVENYLANYQDEGGNVTSVKALLYAKAGKTEDAEATIREAIRIGQSFQHFHHTTYNIACAYALLNNREEALKWLRYTAEDGFPCYPMFEKDPNLSSLRNDARFVSYMSELKQQWEHYKATL